MVALFATLAIGAILGAIALCAGYAVGEGFPLSHGHIALLGTMEGFILFLSHTAVVFVFDLAHKLYYVVRCSACNSHVM